MAAACKQLGLHRSRYYRNYPTTSTGDAEAPRLREGRWILDDESQRARLRELVDQHPEKGRRALSKQLAALHGPSEATIGKFLREEGLSQKEQRLIAAGKDSTSDKPGLGEVLYVARIPSEPGDTSSRTIHLGLDQASAFAFISCFEDSLAESLEKLVAKSTEQFDRRPGKVILDRNGDRYFEIPKAAEDFAKARGISLQLEGRWGKNLLAHRKRLEAICKLTIPSGDCGEDLEHLIADRYNYHESDPLPPCSGRRPYMTFLELKRRHASGSSDPL